MIHFRTETELTIPSLYVLIRIFARLDSLRLYLRDEERAPKCMS